MSGARGYSQFAWTDERVAQLKDLHAQGFTMSQIAARMGGGLTRNAVMGKVHRLGLPGRNPNMANVPPRFTKPRKPRKPVNNGFTFGAHRPPAAPIAPPVSSELHPDGAELHLATDLKADRPYEQCVGLLELKTGQCRFPIKDKFCGAPTCGRGFGSYCAHHAEIAYREAPNPKRKWAEDDSRRVTQAARARQNFLQRQPHKETCYG